MPHEVLLFEGATPTQIAEAAFLTPPGMAGQVAQLKRRRKALKTLGEHTELLRMLVDARERIEDSHDPINERDDEFKALGRRDTPRVPEEQLHTKPRLEACDHP